MELFNGKAMCSACHLSRGTGSHCFTDFTYDNLGVPKNLENPVYAYTPTFIDLGLGGFLKSAGYPYAGRVGQAQGADPSQRRPAQRP